MAHIEVHGNTAKFDPHTPQLQEVWKDTIPEFSHEKHIMTPEHWTKTEVSPDFEHVPSAKVFSPHGRRWSKAIAWAHAHEVKAVGWKVLGGSSQWGSGLYG